ncbi:MAG TPA: terminase family protein [Xanthobacteraceae bacterium]|nr:terminase family protein [Xanthobacteraceae bacterium]
MAEPLDVGSALDVARRLREERTVDKLSFFLPHPKQLEFLKTGKQRERALFAANRVGKTTIVCVEVACHATGIYPSWWPAEGKRFSYPVDFILAGKTALSTRDILQTNLLGPPGSRASLGTGWIPKANIIEESKTASHGVSGGIDYIEVKHVSGGISRLFFRTYQQGPDLFEGVTISGGLILDEEPGLSVYGEALMRIATTQGYIAISFTPLLGWTDVVKRFMNSNSPDRAWVNMSLDDALHIPAERREQMKRDPVEPHLRKARIEGLPDGSEHAVFPVDLETIKWDCPPMASLPDSWFYLWGIDPGIGHNFAAVLIGYDRDADIVHVIRGIRVKNQTPLQQAYAMRQIAPNVPVAWPRDAGNREKSSGTALIKFYKEAGLDTLSRHVTNADGSVGLEPGILDMHHRMTTGGILLNRHLDALFQELRDYRRDENGNPVPVNDDMVSALRYAIMGLRSAAQDSLGGQSRRDRTIAAQRNQQNYAQAKAEYEREYWPLTYD